jgi:UDP-3-O-[3-hydroxymyristoyl] glucosamine N-acyltransferase
MYSVKDITKYLSIEDIVLGNLDNKFSNLADAAHINEESLDWIHSSNRHPYQYLLISKANVIIAPISIADEIGSEIEGKTIILTKNVMLLFSRITRDLFVKMPEPGIHPTTYIHPEAIIGENVHIGAFCYIGKCSIGADTIILNNVTIEDGVTIGENVYIKNGARIGQTGFGFVKNDIGEWEKFPQMGKVIIQDNVEIGANTCIDRGALSTTVIGYGTKIDNLGEIAHNVQIGKNCIITGNVCIGGSCIIGDDVWIGPSVTINNGLKIGSKSFISIGSVIIKNLPPSSDVIGNPAEPKELYVKKSYALLKICKGK